MAECNRLWLARFWLVAPNDCLEDLWHGRAGSETRRLGKLVVDDNELTEEESQLFTRLRSELKKGSSNRSITKLVIALLVFSYHEDSGKEGFGPYLPVWLHNSYSEVSKGKEGEEGKTMQHRETMSNEQNSIGVKTKKQIRYRQCGWDSEDGLRSCLGLCNLVYTGVISHEILSQIQEARLALASLINDADVKEIELSMKELFGLAFWGLVQSGLQAYSLLEEDRIEVKRIVSILGAEYTEEKDGEQYLKALIIALTYFPIGNIEFVGSPIEIPAWISEKYKRLRDQTGENNP